MKQIFKRVTMNGRIVTMCWLFDDNGKPVSYGQAVKRPEDNFNRKLGNTIASGRAHVALSTGRSVPCRITRTPRYTRLDHRAVPLVTDTYINEEKSRSLWGLGAGHTDNLD
jgi:hypothetical protein